jgi:hypothetical protein
MPSKALELLELLARRSRDRQMRLVATVEGHRERVEWAWVVVSCCTSKISHPGTNAIQILLQYTMLPALMLLDP